MIGQRLGHYEIVSAIGKGGMGEVWGARDRKLGREVAIKTLPPEFARDADRLARFEREARLLASLNHPNIATIHGLEEHEGARFLVLELVDGETLADRIRRGPLPVDESLQIALQVTEALEAAHEKGVLHRDLKPANIKVTPGGRVKVLDFGLAKALPLDGLESSNAPTASVDGTADGWILGTPAYMSPEQLRGQPVDKRADIWAFGCVLYEMLAGKMAFRGGTLSDTMASVLDHEPDWSRLPADTPAGIRRLLRHCVRKDAGQRLDDIASASSSIKDALALRGSFAASISTAWALLRPASTWTAAGLFLSLAGFLVYAAFDREAPLPRLENPVQVSAAIGVEDYPTLSPDGRTVAYESAESGNWDIWVTQPGGDGAINRTADYTAEDRYPSWSPDGRQIAFWSSRGGGGYYVMPALAGAARRVLSTPGTSDTLYGPAAWSATGEELAAVSYRVAGAAFEAAIAIVSIATGDTRRLPLPGNQEARLDLAWSSDGRYFAYVDGGQQPAETKQLWVLRVSDSQAVPVTDVRLHVRSPAWSADGAYLYYVSNKGGPADLWRQRMSDGTPQGDPAQVTTGLDIRHAALSPDGGRMAYSKGRWIANVWRVPVFEDRPASWDDAEQMTFEQAFIEFVDVSPDGTALAFSSDRAGNQDLYVRPVAGGELRRLTFDPAPDWNPRWSLDGSRVAFYSYRTGNREIYVMPADGGPTLQLTESEGLDATPDWAWDGRQIAFRSERAGSSDIWIVPAAGGEARQVTRDPAGDYSPGWSPDGWLAFFSNRDGVYRLWRTRADGREPEPLTTGPGSSLRWSPDGATIYFVGAEERLGSFWAYSIADGRERPIANLEGRRGTPVGQAPATDGNFLYFAWQEDLGDIWVMDLAAE